MTLKSAWKRFLALVLVMAGLVGSGVSLKAEEAHGPAVFQKGSFVEVSARAAAEDRLLVIDFMAAWCPPCKRMDQMTWPDPALNAWVASYALAIQVDVDRDPELSEKFGIESMPTIVVLKGEQTAGRYTGFRDADELRTWLEQVRTGKEPPPAPAAKDPRQEGQRRLKEARESLAAGNYAKATDQLIWLWENILTLSPSFVGVKYSFLVEDLKQLAAKHPPAREKLASFRDKLTPVVTSEKFEPVHFKDWFHLNRIIQDDEKILAWYEAVAKTPTSFSRLLPVQLDITDFLLEKRKLAEAGKLITDPLTNIRAMLFMGKTGDLLEDASLARFVGGRWLALQAAGRTSEAAQVLKELFLNLGEDPEVKINLMESGIDAGCKVPEFDGWLKEAQAGGKDIASLSQTLKSLPLLKNP